MSGNPEQVARQSIDAHLAAAGWVIQDYKKLDLSAGEEIASYLRVIAKQNPQPQGIIDRVDFKCHLPRTARAR